MCGKHFRKVFRIWIERKGEETMPASQGMLSSEATQYKKLIPVLICLALSIFTIITFWPLKDCGFINMDDSFCVYENAYVQSGLNWNSIGQAFSFSSEMMKTSGWHPVTWLSLMLDYQIFGLNPHGYHLTNLLFHVMNTILLFLIFHWMTKKLWPSAFLAALFAIHPLHVESVAWIAERKDVLSTFFFMLTMGAYSYYVEHPGFRRYSLVLLFFVLGLMAKPMLVTLPFVLLLLDYWPLQRFQEIKPNHKVQAEVFKSVTSDKQEKKSKYEHAVKETLEVKKPADPEYKWSLIYPLLWEKVPLFVLAILSSVVTYIDAQSVGYIKNEVFPLGVRFGNAFISYIAYIGKMIWPSNLAIFYPYRWLLVSWQVFGSVFLLIAITLVVIWRAKKFPYLATGWLWYAGTPVPVIGIVQLGDQAMADRYTYIPLIGLFIMLAWGIPSLIETEDMCKKILFPIGIAVLAILAVLTWQQCGYWNNSFDLFNHALQVTKDNYLAHNNRGSAYDKLGQYQYAIEDFNKTIRLKPDYALAYYNRGTVCGELGQYQHAIEDFDKALRLKPDDAKAYNNRGFIYFKFGQNQRAIEDFNKAIRLKQDYADAYYNRGLTYLLQGNNDLGCADAQKACELGRCKIVEWAKDKGICR
jgi:Tfp pilus assembly protein PilF